MRYNLLKASPKEQRTMQITTAAQIRPPRRPEYHTFNKQYHAQLLKFFEAKVNWWALSERRLKGKAAEERRSHATGWDARVRILDKQIKRAAIKADEFRARLVKQEQYVRYLDTVWEELQEHAAWLDQHGIND